MKYGWLKDIDFEDLLDNDAKLVENACGRDVMLKIWTQLPSIQIYTGGRWINEARKRYIYKHYDGTNINELAVKLNISSRFVKAALKERNQPNSKDNKQESSLFS